MNKKLLVGGMVFLMLCLLLLGSIFLVSSKRYEGSMVHTGYYSGDKFVSTYSGSIGANPSKMEQFKVLGSVCLILSGLSGIAAIVVKIGYKD